MKFRIDLEKCFYSSFCIDYFCDISITSHKPNKYQNKLIF